MRKQRTYRRNVFTAWEVVWGLIIAILTLYVVYRIPLDLTLGVGQGFRLPILDFAVMIGFLLDPIVTLRSFLLRDKETRRGFIRYVLPIDVVAAIAVVFLDTGDWWTILALLKLLHVTVFITLWRHQLLKRGNVVRLALFTYWLAVLIHVTACGWIEMRYTKPIVHPESAYLVSIYWSVTTLTTIGYGDITPKNADQMKYTIVIMLVGFVLMGYLIGNIASLLNKPDPLRAQYANALEEVSAFVQYHNLPADLQRRIVDYFGYMWQQRAAFDESNILTLLPSGIRTEVSLHLKRDVIQRVPFFRDATENFIREIASEMRPLVVTPGEFVFHSGDPAGNMYFISRGNLEVVDSSGQVIGSLSDGDFFGEMALLEKRRRMGAVRALDYCDLYELSYEAFHRIVDAHPDFRFYMQDIARRRAEATSTADQGTIR